MNAVVGKIGFLLSQLLTEEDLDDLLDSDSVPEIAEKLRKTVYGDYIPDIEDIHRRDLEAAIQKRYQAELESLDKFFTFPEKSILEHLLLRCEIESVKRVLRILFSGEDIEERFLACLGSVPKFSSVQDFVSSLSGKPYYRILSSVHGASGGVARMENSLDYWYFSRLLKKLRLSGKTKRVVKVFKEQVDLMNVMWIYRARVLFGYEKERVMNLLLPFGKVFRGPDLEDLASSKSVEEILDKIKGTPYSGCFEHITKFGEFVMRREVDKYLRRKFVSFVKNYMNPFEMVVGYLHLLEYEVENLITVIESVRYKLEKGASKEYLVI